MEIKVKQMQSQNKRKNRLGKAECVKIMKNLRLTEKKKKEKEKL